MFVIAASCKLNTAFGSDLRITLTENKPLEFASSETNLSSQLVKKENKQTNRFLCLTPKTLWLRHRVCLPREPYVSVFIEEN